MLCCICCKTCLTSSRLAPLRGPYPPWGGRSGCGYRKERGKKEEGRGSSASHSGRGKKEERKRKERGKKEERKRKERGKKEERKRKERGRKEEGKRKEEEAALLIPEEERKRKERGKKEERKRKERGKKEEGKRKERGRKRKQRLSFRKRNGKGKRKGLSLVWGYFLNGYRWGIARCIANFAYCMYAIVC